MHTLSFPVGLFAILLSYKQLVYINLKFASQKTYLIEHIYNINVAR